MKRSTQLGWHVILATALLAFIPRAFSYPLYIGGGIATKGQPSSVVSVDINGDGAPDLLIIDYGSLGVYLNNGDGTFGPETVYTFPLGAGGFLALAAADLGNGKIDVVASTPYQSKVAVYIGNGDGTFQNPAFYDVPAEGCPAFCETGLVIADLGNGHPDVVVNNFQNDSVSVLIGNGDGTLKQPVTYPAGDGPAALAVADVDGDGKSDIVVANFNDYTIRYLPGRGDGTMKPAITVVNEKTAVYIDAHPFGVDAVDLGNGHTDIVALLASNQIGVLVGNGDGTFQTQTTYMTGTNQTAMTTADLGNGHLDVLVACGGSDTINVFLGNGDGTLQPFINVFPGGVSPFGIAVADVNRDGRPDILAANNNSNDIGILYGNGDGTVGSQSSVSVGQSPQGVALGDLNGDGHPDIVVTNGGDGTVGVLIGKGGTSFKPQVTYPVGNDPTAVVVQDLGTGHQSVVELNKGDSTVGVLLGNGDGTLQPMVTYTLVTETGTNHRDLQVTDLGNGQADILVTNHDDNSVSVLLGNGDGTFQPMTTIPVTAGPSSIAAGDFGTGHTDVVVASDISRMPGTDIGNLDYDMQVLFGNGDGTFQSTTKTYVDVTAVAPNAMVTGDFGNGQTDILSFFWLLLGNGDGTFNVGNAIGLGSDPYALTVGDVNGDGKPDELVVDFIDDTVGIVLGNGDGTFGSKTNNLSLQAYPVGRAPTGLAVGVLGTDGWPDLVVSNSADNSLTILEHLNPTPEICTASPTVTGTGTINGVLCATDVYGLPLIYTVASGTNNDDMRRTLSIQPQNTQPASTLSGPFHGKITQFDPKSGSFTYVPDKGFVGSDKFTWQSTNGHATLTTTEHISVIAPKPPTNAGGGGGGGSTGWISLALLGFLGLLQKKRI